MICNRLQIFKNKSMINLILDLNSDLYSLNKRYVYQKILSVTWVVFCLATNRALPCLHSHYYKKCLQCINGPYV